MAAPFARAHVNATSRALTLAMVLGACGGHEPATFGPNDERREMPRPEAAPRDPSPAVRAGSIRFEVAVDFSNRPVDLQDVAGAHDVAMLELLAARPGRVSLIVSPSEEGTSGSFLMSAVPVTRLRDFVRWLATARSLAAGTRVDLPTASPSFTLRIERTADAFRVSNVHGAPRTGAAHDLVYETSPAAFVRAASEIASSYEAAEQAARRGATQARTSAAREVRSADGRVAVSYETMPRVPILGRALDVRLFVRNVSSTSLCLPPTSNAGDVASAERRLELRFDASVRPNPPAPVVLAPGQAIHQTLRIPELRDASRIHLTFASDPDVAHSSAMPRSVLMTANAVAAMQCWAGTVTLDQPFVVRPSAWEQLIAPERDFDTWLAKRLSANR